MRTGSTRSTPRVGATYTVCVSQSVTEAQTQPAQQTPPTAGVNNTGCGSVPAIAGYTGTATAPVSGLDFGLANGVVGTCGTEMTAQTPAGATSYDATLNSGDTCTQKAKDQKLVFNTWTDASGTVCEPPPDGDGSEV